VLGALLGPGGGAADPDAALAKRLEAHEQAMQDYAQRFTGRSPFYIPPVRPPERTYTPRPEPPEKPDPPEPEDDGPTEPPKRVRGPYAGPSVIFAVGSEVWFQPPGPGQSQLRLRVGETAHGLTLKEVHLPGQIVVEWDGFEYNLDLLGKNFPGNWSSGDATLTKAQADNDGSTPGLVMVPEDGPMPEQMYQPDDAAPQQSPEEQVATTADIETPRQRPRPISAQMRTAEQERQAARRDLILPGRDESQTEAESEQTPEVSPFAGPPIPPHIRRQMEQAQRDADAADAAEADAAADRSAPDADTTSRNADDKPETGDGEQAEEDGAPRRTPSSPQSQTAVPS